jgi:hypothetical protein
MEGHVGVAIIMLLLFGYSEQALQALFATHHFIHSNANFPIFTRSTKSEATVFRLMRQQMGHFHCTMFEQQQYMDGYAWCVDLGARLEVTLFALFMYYMRIICL